MVKTIQAICKTSQFPSLINGQQYKIEIKDLEEGNCTLFTFSNGSDILTPEPLEFLLTNFTQINTF